MSFLLPFNHGFCFFSVQEKWFKVWWFCAKSVGHILKDYKYILFVMMMLSAVIIHCVGLGFEITIVSFFLIGCVAS